MAQGWGLLTCGASHHDGGKQQGQEAVPITIKILSLEWLEVMTPPPKRLYTGEWLGDMGDTPVFRVSFCHALEFLTWDITRQTVWGCLHLVKGRFPNSCKVTTIPPTGRGSASTAPYTFLPALFQTSSAPLSTGRRQLLPQGGHPSIY